GDPSFDDAGEDCGERYEDPPHSPEMHLSFPSVARCVQAVDFVGQPMAFVGDDSLDGCKPILDRPEFGAQLRILAGQQLDAFHLLRTRLRIERLTPPAVQRITILDSHPGCHHPAKDHGDWEYGDRGCNCMDDVKCG